MTGVRVMTRNLYVGASLDPIAQAAGPEDLPACVDVVWADVVASDPAGRLAAIAGEIAGADPDLVALQEVALWRGPGAEYDFLALLLDALAARGAAYRAAAVGENFGGVLPSTRGAVELRDRGAILAAERVAVSSPRTGRFHAAARLPVAGVEVEVARGWASALARAGGVELRLVAAHLELPIAPVAPVQRAQAQELASLVDGEPEVVVAGDLNSDPGRPSAAAYDLLRDCGLADAWLDAGGDPRGDTCCQARDLRNPTSSLFERIDHVLYRGRLAPVDAFRTGARASERTPGSLWPSDHAGVVVVFVRGSGAISGPVQK